MRGAIVSISGPSKSGKSMLVKRVAKQSHVSMIAEVSGANVSSVDDLWQEALDNLGTPSATEHHKSSTDETKKTAKAGVDVGVQLGGDAHKRDSETETDVMVDSRRGLHKLTEVVDVDNFVLLIDDFHYIDKDIQPDIAEALKGAAESGISICVALVGYRSENLEKVNDDLTGRVRSIELDYWADEDLEEIAEIGFEVLNVEFPSRVIDKLVKEAAGSPLLMQLLCYSTCIQNDITEPAEPGTNINVHEGDISDIFREAIQWGGYSDVVDAIYQGAITRGGGRVKYEFRDGGEGDFYECCLRAIAKNPPKFSFRRHDLYDRVKGICTGKHPQVNQVTLFCEKMQELAEAERPDTTLVTWDEGEDILHISEPGLLFHIRWAMRLGLHNSGK